MRKQLLVESIRIDGETQSRDRMNEETVAEYAEAMQAPPAGSRPGPAWPPVEVFFDGTEYWMADGFHRLLAAQRVGRKNIEADVKRGTREDAAWASCAANQTHGLRRTNADKRKAVEMALKLRSDMSDRAIAEHCGVSRMLPGNIRRRCHSMTPENGQRQGKDGKTYPVPPPPPPRRSGGPAAGPPPTPRERRVRRTVGGGQSADRAARPEGSPCPESAETGPVDDVGRRIPEHLVDLWGRRQEVQDLLTALSRVRVALREAQDSRDPLFSEIPFSSALAHLDQAYDAVQVAKPYAVCAFCQGHGCKACGQRGLLGKFRWDTSVPKEHKEAIARMVAQEHGGSQA